MTAIVWDAVGSRKYQTGIDRGVLYPQGGNGVAWNGLVSVEETSTQTLKSFYLDGVKYLDNLLPGDFSGKLKAFTYPDEFELINGIAAPSDGLRFHDQPFKSFNLSYRTKVGNDLDGVDHGYTIHLLYNLVANPDTIAFATLTDSAIQPIEFAWTLSGTPPTNPSSKGYRPTVHISIDSEDTDPEVLQAIEDIIWGTDTTAPHFPSISEILDLFQSLGALIIVDNGDGTWQAIDNGDNYITMNNPTQFTIDNADAAYIDATTYQISSTNLG
jgi:hypothetical protein